jgi:hypothetical protein
MAVENPLGKHAMGLPRDGDGFECHGFHVSFFPYIRQQKTEWLSRYMAHQTALAMRSGAAWHS